MIATILPFLNQFWPAISKTHPGFGPLPTALLPRFVGPNDTIRTIFEVPDQIVVVLVRIVIRVEIFRDFFEIILYCRTIRAVWNYRVAKQCLLFELLHYYRKHFQNRRINSLFFHGGVLRVSAISPSA